MNEIQEAEKFSAELDRILKGEPASSGLDAEMAADLAFAAKLARLDRSAESRDKNKARTKLLERAEGNRLRAILNRAGVRPSVLAAAAVMLIVGLAMIRGWKEEEGGNPVAPFQNYNFSDFGSASISEESAVTGGLNPSASEQIPTGALQGSHDKGPGGSKSVGESLAFLEAKERLQRNLELDSKRSGRASSNFGGGAMNTPRAKKAVMKRQIDVAALRGSNGLKMSPERRVADFSRTASALQGLGYASPEPMPSQPLDREGYAHIVENAFMKTKDAPLSTFSIDVDAASYANTRRMLNANQLPPADAVRLEEFINYFKYDYPEPEGEHPFSITTEVAACPWNAKHKLVRVGIKGMSVPLHDLPPNNLVFLVDTSGSMMSADKLPLLKQGLKLLVAQLRKQDKVAIVAYAGSAGLVLPSTSDKKAILDALDRLEAGGSTAGGAGIQLAYQTAQANFLKKGNNRVILATDGDFNVGVTSDGELTRLIEEKRKTGVFLSVLGFGTGNYQDAKMEQLADKGNGNYAYIDDLLEAEKVLVKQMGGTLLTIAKDVKIQVEFNPSRAQGYKLIGYENRMLAAEDFRDDKKDAGELGAGHTVTALYEVIPAGSEAPELRPVDDLKYQKKPEAAEPETASRELLTVKFRYKKPKEDVSRLITRPLADEDRAWDQASSDFKFAASAAGFGMLLRNSSTAGDLSYAKVRAMAAENVGKDADGWRAEMVRLVDKAQLLSRTSMSR